MTKRLSRTNILVVEKDLAVAVVLSALLGKEGFVQTVGNGQAALQRVQEEYFDVIITDIKMPVMNGIEFYKQAAARFPGIGKRFLFIMAPNDEPASLFFKLNSLAYITKPVDTDEIVKKVREILKGISDYRQPCLF